MNSNDDEYSEDGDAIINEEYKIWKKNCPFLYDTLISHAFTWPSLTVSWIPLREKYTSHYRQERNNFSLQKLIVGTHTSGEEPNSLMIVKVRIPVDQKDSDVVDKQEDLKAESIKIEPEIIINHQGEVNKARPCPFATNLIATKTPSGEVHIFNYFNHSSRPTDSIVKPDLRLLGHDDEGYGLDWSTRKEGYLLSGGYDQRVS